MLKLKQDCLFESAKQVFKTVGLSKWDTDNEDYKANNNNTCNDYTFNKNNRNNIINNDKIIIIMIMVITYIA